jgi:pSer/pThr/pTyr-binding forkhead associated (FHA) protein
MPAQLLSPSDGPSLLLDKPILLVGRHEECDIQLNSRKVSRKHCVLAQVGEALVVRDLGSTNGVRINGERVEEGRLKTGDELTIGNFKYQVHVDQRRDAPKQLAPGESPGAERSQAAESSPGARNSSPVSEDDMLEAADEPVPLPEPGGDVHRTPDSYQIPGDLQIKSESSLPPPAAG